jgi:hypothetical protein
MFKANLGSGLINGKAWVIRAERYQSQWQGLTPTKPDPMGNIFIGILARIN